MFYKIRQYISYPIKVAFLEYRSALFLHVSAIFLKITFKGKWKFAVIFRRDYKGKNFLKERLLH